jgi:signal transduction histidine kinase
VIWQHNPYSVPLLFGALILVSFAIYAWQYRANRATTMFIIYTAGSALLLVAYAGELSFADLPTMMAWARVQYVATFLPGFFLLFVLSYTRRIDSLSPAVITLIFAVPVINTVLAYTNEYHHLIWVASRTVEINGDIYFMRTYGRVSIIFQILEILAGVTAMVVLALEMRRGTPLFRWQGILLIIAALLPLIGYLFSMSPINPFPPLRMFMIGFAFSCIPIGYSLFRYQLLDILPAAYDLVITSMKDAVIVVNVEQRIVSVNPSAAQMLKKPSRQMVGCPLVEAFEDAPELAGEFMSLGDTHVEVSVGAGEAQQVFDLMVSPLILRNGKLAGHVIVLHDITSSKLAERAAAEVAERLAERNRMLDTYSHTVAHDLKSPLHLVVGYLDLLRLDVPPDFPPPLKSYIQLASDATLGMAEMIDNLLLLARLDDIQTVTEIVSIDQVVRDAVDSLTEQIEMRKVVVQIEPDLPDVLGYAPWLEHVFSNLIGNAIKYIGKDNKSPRIIVRGVEKSDVARFEIVDNGLGIQMIDQQRLFDRFSRFHKGEAPGSGLGLTIVELIVRRLGGKLGVDSEPEKGSTFWFELPMPAEGARRSYMVEQARAGD